jgi:hypothetical protein
MVVCTVQERNNPASKHLIAALGGIPVVRVNFAAHANFFQEAKPLFVKLVEDKMFTEQSLVGFQALVSQCVQALRG